MAAPIPTPLLNGVRQSFVSTQITFANGAVGNAAGGQALALALRGYKSATYGRTRTRTIVYGNHPDPLGKTKGKNEYKFEAEYLIAEVQAIRDALQALAGAGYGDVFFQAIITHSENGFDTIVDTIKGCTLDMDELALAEGTEPTMSKLSFTPLKVLMNGVDDLAVPLQPATGGA